MRTQRENRFRIACCVGDLRLKLVLSPHLLSLNGLLGRLPGDRSFPSVVDLRRQLHR